MDIILIYYGQIIRTATTTNPVGIETTIRVDNGGHKHVEQFGLFDCRLNKFPFGELEHFAIEWITGKFAVYACYGMTGGHRLKKFEIISIEFVDIAHGLIETSTVDRLCIGLCREHTFEIKTIFGQRARLVEHERIQRAAYVDRAWTYAVDLLLAQSIL